MPRGEIPEENRDALQMHPTDKIRMVDMFDGRLAKHGVHEEIIPPALRAVCGTTQTYHLVWNALRKSELMAEGIDVEREEVIYERTGRNWHPESTCEFCST